jgi:hypothetical protein
LPVLLPAALLALGLAGLPLTGGGLAKLAIKSELGEGPIGIAASLSAAGSALLMLHFLRQLSAIPPPSAAAARAGRLGPWLALAIAAVAIPWATYPLAQAGARVGTFAPASLIAGLWPVVLGALIAAVLQRQAWQLPAVPEGDIVIVGERAVGIALVWSGAIARADNWLREWPIASLSLSMVAIALAAALVIWR